MAKDKQVKQFFWLVIACTVLAVYAVITTYPQSQELSSANDRWYFFAAVYTVMLIIAWGMVIKERLFVSSKDGKKNTYSRSKSEYKR